MFKLVLLLIALAVVQVQSQDKSFCDIDKITPSPAQLPAPKLDIGKYQAKIERNKQSRNATEEITEYFDAIDNIAVSNTKYGFITLRSYCYYETNEILSIDASKVCRVTKLNETIQMLTPFYMVIDKNGKERILSPLQYLVNSASYGVLVNIDDSVVRGISANNWQTCAYAPATGQTLKITLSFVDPLKWDGAVSAEAMQIPLQVLIESIDSNGKLDSDIHVITEFKPYITNGDEEFFTPSGVYCPGRRNVAPLPKIPDRFEFQAEIVQPFFMDLLGFINETREQYDYTEKLFRQDFSVYNSLVTEIHDFNTGLKFRLDQNSGNCSIDKIDGSGVDAVIDANGQVNIRDPSTFFDFDSNNYQYTGRRLIHGVETDVWIGKKNINGLDGTFEWYFLTSKWVDVDTSKKDISVPILCIISVSAVNPQTNQPTTQSVMYSFTNFQTAKTLLLTHDISQCGTGLKKGFFIFKLTTWVSRDSIRQKWITFNNHIIKEIKERAKIPIIRITNLNVEMKNDTKEDIVVTFELFEKIGRYGDVTPPEYDVTLTDAVLNLKNAIDGGTFGFNLTLTNNRRVKISAKPNSLEKLVNRDQVDSGVSTGAVAGIVVVVTLVGIVLSVLLIILHKNKTITLPFI